MECAQNVTLTLDRRQREPTFFSKETILEIALREKYDGYRELELTHVKQFTEIIPGRPDREAVNQ